MHSRNHGAINEDRLPNGLVSIGLCADTHYWPSGQNWVTADGALQLQGASDALLAALVDDLAQANLDLVLHLGDQTCGGGTYGMPAAEYQRALQQLHHAFATLDTPVHVLPGNHDSTPGAGNWSNFRQLWAVEQGCGMTIDLGPLRLVLLNTHGHSPAQIAAAHEGDPVYGWVDEAELGRLEAALATAGERPVLLFTHQLLYPWSNRAGWQDYYGVENAQAVLGLLERYGNVRAVFQAHAHRFDLQAVALGEARQPSSSCPRSSSIRSHGCVWM